MSMNRLWMAIDCASRRGPQEACYELRVCACARSAVYSRFALLPMLHSTNHSVIKLYPTMISSVSGDHNSSHSSTSTLFCRANSHLLDVESTPWKLDAVNAEPWGCIDTYSSCCLPDSYYSSPLIYPLHCSLLFLLPFKPNSSSGWKLADNNVFQLP
jgi:hypothetical protein